VLTGLQVVRVSPMAGLGVGALLRGLMLTVVAVGWADPCGVDPCGVPAATPSPPPLPTQASTATAAG
jgi:hypothetical protein